MLLHAQEEIMQVITSQHEEWPRQLNSRLQLLRTEMLVIEDRAAETTKASGSTPTI